MSEQQPQLWPPDRGGEDPERIRKYYQSAIVLALVDAYEIEPLDAVCRQTATDGMLWTAAYEITQEHVERIAKEPAEEGEVAKMVVQYYKDELPGYWMISGRDQLRAGAFQFPDLEQLAFAYALAEEYMSGPDS